MTTLWVLAVVLSASVFGFGREWNPDRNRSYWFCLLSACAVLPFMPSLWLQGLYAVMLLRLAWGLQPLERIKRMDDDVLVAAVFALLVPAVTRDMVTPALWALVVAGLWTTLYAAVSLRRFDPVHGYALSVNVTRWYHVRFYDHQSHIAAGQGNPNHLHGLAALSVAAACGLEGLGSALAPWLIPLLVAPVFIAQFVRTDNPGHWQRPQQGWAHLLVLVLAALPLRYGLAGWAVFAALGALVLAVLWRNRHHDTGPDSGRALLWWGMIREWWPDGWATRLFGWGAKEFENRYIAKVAKEAPTTNQFIVAHQPHSEYVCCLLEHGLLGLALLLGYLASRLWLLPQAGPEGVALYLVGMVLCSIAFVSFPWSWYHEILFRVECASGSPQMANRLFTLGTPALFGIVLVVALLVEAVVR